MKKTKLTRSLLAACSIVALSAVMYGCIGGGDDDPATDETDMEQPTEPMQTPAEQLAAAEAALETAQEAVAELTPTSTGEEARAAYEALADAQTAVNAATALPANKIAALQTQLDAANAYGTVAVAIIAAQGAINELGDEPAAADVATAAALVTAARTALTGATALDADATTSLTNQVASVETQIADIQTAVAARPTPEQIAEEEKAAANVAAEGERVAGAIGPDGTLSTYAGTDNDAATFTVNGGEVADEDADTAADMDNFAKSADAPLAIIDWAGSMYTHMVEDDADTENVDESMTTTVVSYTDIEDPEDQAYSVYYSADAASGREAVDTANAAGVLQLDENDIAGNHELFIGDFGITAAYQTIPGPADDGDTADVDEAEVSIMGSFNGIPGTFECASECERSSDKDGNLSGLGGSWTFTPAEQEMGDDPYMVAGVIDDTDYLDFGYWMVGGTDADGEATLTVGTFARGEMQHTSIADVDGTASYSGAATGLYMKKTFDTDGAVTPVASGQFTADASLMATFGQVPVSDTDDRGTIAANLLNTITGTIGSFRDGSGAMIDEAWSAELDGTIVSNAFSGTTTGEGAFSGSFYGDDTETDGVVPAPEGNETLKLPNEAELAAGALEVVDLGVGLALLVHHHQLRAEAEEREAPVVKGDAEAAGAVLPRGAILHEREPEARALIVVRPPHLAADAHVEAERQDHRDAGPQPAGAGAVAERLGAVPPVAAGEIQPHGGRDHPAGAHGGIEDRPVEEGAGAVAAPVPGRLPRYRDVLAHAVPHLETAAELAVVGRGADPALAGAAQHAQLRASVDQPAGPEMGRDEELIEPGALVLPPRELGACAQAEVLGQRIVILRPAPDRDADARRGQLLHVTLEGEVEDVDGPLLRRAADVAVRRERRAEPVRPAPARLQLRQEAPDVGDDRLGRVGRQHDLEMAPRQLLLTLEVERARELQPHPKQPRFLDQHGAEGADGLVQQVLPRVVGHTGQLRRPRCREAVEEDRVGLDHIA